MVLSSETAICEYSAARAPRWAPAPPDPLHTASAPPTHSHTTRPPIRTPLAHPLAHPSATIVAAVSAATPAAATSAVPAAAPLAAPPTARTPPLRTDVWGGMLGQISCILSISTLRAWSIQGQTGSARDKPDAAAVSTGGAGAGWQQRVRHRSRQLHTGKKSGGKGGKGTTPAERSAAKVCGDRPRRHDPYGT